MIILERMGRPSAVLSGLAEVTMWKDEGGRLVKLEVELLKPYAVDEKYVERFLEDLKW